MCVLPLLCNSTFLCWFNSRKQNWDDLKVVVSEPGSYLGNRLGFSGSCVWRLSTRAWVKMDYGVLLLKPSERQEFVSPEWLHNFGAVCGLSSHRPNPR